MPRPPAATEISAETRAGEAALRARRRAERDRAWILAAIRSARPEAQRLIAEIDGLVEMRTDLPRGEAIGLAEMTLDARRGQLRRALAERRPRARPRRRGPARARPRGRLPAGRPTSWSQELDRADPARRLLRRLGALPTGACTAVEERFADTFAKWALRGRISLAGSGYGIPAPRLDRGLGRAARPARRAAQRPLKRGGERGRRRAVLGAVRGVVLGHGEPGEARARRRAPRAPRTRCRTAGRRCGRCSRTAAGRRSRRRRRRSGRGSGRSAAPRAPAAPRGSAATVLDDRSTRCRGGRSPPARPGCVWSGPGGRRADVLRGEASDARRARGTVPGRPSMCAMPIQSSVPLTDGLRRVEVGVHVEVDEPDALAGRQRAGHGADPDGAVAAEDDRRAAGAERRLDPLGDLARRLRDAGRVLGAPVLAVRAPAA